MLLESSYHPSVPITKLNHPKHNGLYLARLDLLPYPASGNKWFKLKYNLLEAKRLGIQTLITFGGAYSNHLYATAEAAHHWGFRAIGIVRGEEHHPLNDTLRYCEDKGMSLRYMSREDYRQKTDPGFLEHWLDEQELPIGYLIPEGGSNTFAVKGVAELVDLLPADTDIIATACGTGATLAGLISGLKSHQEAWGIAVLKEAGFLKADVEQLLSSAPVLSDRKWEMWLDYHGGGYAKISEELLNFIRRFQQEQGILLDPIYTSKLLFGLFDLADKSLLPQDKKIVALHTGGLQSWNGLPEKKRIFLSE